jgi:hypothetical protein
MLRGIFGPMRKREEITAYFGKMHYDECYNL